MCEWCKDYSEAKNDPVDLGPMYVRGPSYHGRPIYDETQYWQDNKKKGRIREWLRKYLR